ncbi:hypothetical protein [Caballeronia glathei]|uniref:hypothetical protein n=1 Tax=Caballeronia glathei TaxID=60547 RepID=UPI00101AB098|nr:hypothetical protein [Caballeronia glathei]
MRKRSSGFGLLKTASPLIEQPLSCLGKKSNCLIGAFCRQVPAPATLLDAGQRMGAVALALKS